jgi:hypothetical protein
MYVLVVENHGNSGYRLITSKRESSDGDVVLQQFHIRPSDIEDSIAQWEKVYFDVEHRVERKDVV